MQVKALCKGFSLVLIILISHGTLVSQNLSQIHFTNATLLSQGNKDKEIITLVSELISAVPKDEEIFVCIFKLEDTQIIESLIEANKRGVNVNIILNRGPTSNKENEPTAKLFEQELSHFYYLENTISDEAIIHNKFILFSKLKLNNKEHTHVLLQTSSNFTEDDEEKVQDLILLDDPSLYHCFRDYWFDIQVLGKNILLENYTYFNCESPNLRYKSYFFPKRKKNEAYGDDNIEKLLKKIIQPETAEIYFLHAKWGDERKNILDELEDLKDDGARISVISNNSIDKEVRKKLEDLEITTHYIDKDVLNIHSKIILLNAKFEDNLGPRVLTGSHNLTEKSMERNFEVLLEVRNENIVSEYHNYILELLSIVDQD